MFYEFLTKNDAIMPADVIFVLAGRMDRKKYGIELFRAGVAPLLVLSIGRFEVSKLRSMQLEGTDELIFLRDAIPAPERHFFMKFNKSGVQVEKAQLQRWNTYGEVLAVRQLLQSQKASRAIIVSTDIHLRRVALVAGKLFQGETIDLRFCPVPPHLTTLRKEKWWMLSNDRRYVLSEMIKLTGYRLILWMPPWAVRRMMKLKP